MTTSHADLGIDAEALRTALMQQSESLKRFLKTRIPQRYQSIISVDDVFQEVCTAAFRSRMTFKYNRPDALERWLTSIAQNQLLTMLKAASCLKRGGDRRFVGAAARSQSYLDLGARIVSPERSPSGEARLHEASHALHVALASLASDQREMIILRFIDGLSLDEIADQTGRSKPAVRGLLFRGLRELKSSMGDPARFMSDITLRNRSASNAAF